MTLLLVSPAQPDDRLALALHAPDGFLSAPVSVVMWLVTLALLAVAVSRWGRTLDERAVPLMGVTAAFIFAAQMIDFPVLLGTSGHLLGGLLAAVLLGPWGASVVMASVIGVQALVFQDGGLLVLGANIFDMGFVGTLGGYGVYLLLTRLLGGEERARLPSAAVAAWSSVVLGALAMTLQLAVSGTTPLAVALPPMLGIHAVIGIGEALITVGALALLGSVRPDLLRLRRGEEPRPQAVA